MDWRDRYANNPNDYRNPRGGGPAPSRDDGPNNHHRGGLSGNRRPFDGSPPRYSLNSGDGGGGFGDGDFGPVGPRGDGRNYNNINTSEFEVLLSGQKRFNPKYEVPLQGQKRQFLFSGQRGSPPDRFGAGNFEKRNFDGDNNFNKRHVDGGNFDKKQSEDSHRR